MSYCMLNPACKVSNTSQACLVFLVSGPHVDEWKSYGAFRDFYEEELEGGSTFLEEFDMKILDDFNMVDSEFCKSLLLGMLFVLVFGTVLFPWTQYLWFNVKVVSDIVDMIVAVFLQ